MTEFQVTSWRDIPSMVASRDGDEIVKIPLHQRCQEAIDEAAMRLGDVAADAYLAGWVRSEWTAREGSPSDVAAEVARDLEESWDEARGWRRTLTRWVPESGRLARRSPTKLTPRVRPRSGTASEGFPTPTIAGNATTTIGIVATAADVRASAAAPSAWGT